jgi:hypothetical protein
MIAKVRSIEAANYIGDVMSVQPSLPKPIDPDSDKGAVEGDRPTDKQHYNRNAPALNEDGLPSDHVAIAEDAIGANVDGSEG